MYSPLIVQKKLVALQSKIDSRPKHLRFNLTRFSVEDSYKYNEHLLTLTEGKYVPGKSKSWKWKKPLTQQDANFIENERLLCQNDFMYWATHYAYIKSKLSDETETIILYPPKIATWIILDVWAEAEEKHHAIMILYLKARQLGVSTLNELAIAHRVQFSTPSSPINALVASSDPDKTKKMAAMMQLAWECQPPWMVPDFNIAVSKEVWAFFPETKSSVTCQHGTAMSGIARGDTPDVFHISELPDFNRPEEDIDAALLNAVHEDERTFGVLESTAKGKSGKGKWWYDKWQYAKKWYPQNKTRLRPVFLPWFIGSDLYPTKTWEHQFCPKPLSSWTPKEETLLHAEKCRQYVDESKFLKKYLGEGYTLPLRQQYWWEFTRAEYDESNKLYKFLEEVPSSDSEAFQRSGRGVISVEQAEFLRNHAKPLAKWHGKPAVFGIIGTGILPEQEPPIRTIDVSRPFITVKVDWDLGTEKVYRLVPLHHDPDAWDNRLLVWEFPNFNVPLKPEFALGIDGSEGLEGRGDNSVIEAVKKGTLAYPSEQCAEFSSSTLSMAELLPFALAIGTFYSNVADSNNLFQCKQAVETAFGGHGLQHHLRLAGWYNFHQWHGAYDNYKRRTVHKIGWETNTWTRPLLITNVIMAIKSGFFRIHSPFLIDELSNLQRDDDSNRIEGKGDDHDDRFFAAGIPFFSLHDWELWLMSQGDSKIANMFKFHGSELPQEADIPSLADSIAKAEKKREIIGKVDHHVMDNILPTLPTLD